MANKTLTATVLSLALGLNITGCDKGNGPQQIQPQPHFLSGKIISIDEDSFAVGHGRGGANFKFEHFRIEASDGKTYKLIFPGPSNYQVGDAVDFRYKAQSKISYMDLINEIGKDLYLYQDGFFDADGLILR